MTIKSQLYPDGVDRSGALPLSSRTVPMGATGIPLTGAPAVEATPASTATPSTCSRPWCDEPVFSRLTGRCERHSERWLSDLQEYTDDIGRGEL